VLPLSFETIDYLLHSSGVGGKATREVLGRSPDQNDIFFMSGYMEVLASDNGAPASPMRKASSPEEMIYQMEEIYAPEMPVPALTSPGSPSLPDTTPPTAVRPRSSGTRRPSPTSRRRVTTISSAQAAEQTYLFNLNIQIPQGIVPAAEEFMSALVTNLRNALANAFDEHALRLKGQLRLAEEETGRAEDDLRKKQYELREISGSRVLERNSILGEISNLHNNIDEIERRYATDQVTVDTTAKRIAELQARIQVEMEKDSITDELKRLLELQQMNVINVDKLSDSGRASTTDLADAQEKLTRARIDLAQRQEQLSKSKGGNQIEALNSTLTNLSMQVAQYKAHIAGYERQLAQAEALLGKADDYELLSLKADIAKQSLQEVLVWRDRLSRQIRMIQPPTVSVIGAD
jgi:predicted  nucleic acid-binding Zn-ribbon protein